MPVKVLVALCVLLISEELNASADQAQYQQTSEIFSKKYQRFSEIYRYCLRAIQLFTADQDITEVLTLKAPSKICSRRHSKIFFSTFQRKQVLTFHVNRLLGMTRLFSEK